MSKYLFRRLDNDEVVELPFSYVMAQDSCGFVQLNDDAWARRCVHLELERDGTPEPTPVVPCSAPLISNAMGFPKQQLADFEADRAAHGFTDVDFRPSPECPEVYQVVCGSESARNKYAAHRGMIECNSRSGSKMGKEELEMAKDMVKDRYG